MDFEHLKTTNQTYVPHSWFALRWGFYLIVTGILSIVHGVFPFLFPAKAPHRVMRVARLILQRGHKYEIPPEDYEFWSRLENSR